MEFGDYLLAAFTTWVICIVSQVYVLRVFLRDFQEEIKKINDSA